MFFRLRKPISNKRRIQWLIFVLLSLLFFPISHDVTIAPFQAGDYNRGQDDIVENVENGSVGRQIAVLGLAAVAILSFMSYSSGTRLRPDGALGGLLIAFALWSGASILWADDFTQAIKRFFVFAVLSAVALAVVRMLSITQILQWSYCAMALFLLIALFIEVSLGGF